MILLDPSLEATEEIISLSDNVFSDACKLAESHSTLWKREDAISRELGTCLCSVDAVHNIFRQNKPWCFLDYLNKSSEKWNVTALVANPAVCVICPVESFKDFPHIQTFAVPRAGHWIQNDFPEVVVEEALKAVAELETDLLLDCL